MKKNQTYPTFSFYNGPIANLIPKTSITINDVHRGITSGNYQRKIDVIRSLSTKEEKDEIKRQLDYVTFAGNFSQRNSKSLINLSGYLCIDLDHIELDNLPIIRKKLIHDKEIETQLLFTSPTGKGLKWIVETDVNQYGYKTCFLGVVEYLKNTHGLDKYIDTKVKDIARACFMSHDPEAYIHPKYL